VELGYFSMRIYLDYAASTPVAPEVLKAMTPYWSEKFGNPSSAHSFGREAEIVVDEARETLAKFFEVDFDEVYFTSGATEANNWVAASATNNKQLTTNNSKPHVITTEIEHESLLEPIKELERQGKIEATYLKPSRDGFISASQVEAALNNNTVLVSVIYVNNEIGTVQPIKEIGKVIEKFKSLNVQRLKEKALNLKPSTLYPVFHTDAVQAVQLFEPRLSYIKVDAMTVSGHKLYAPKGVGVLIARKDVPLLPLLRGGGQEFEQRSGTLNVPGIVGLGKAIELLSVKGVRQREHKRLAPLKEQLTNGILQIIPGAKLTTSKEPQAGHIVNVIIPRVQSQIMLIALDQAGIAVSAGAACSAKSVQPSPVLLSLGYSADEALRSLRFSLGRLTTKKEIEATLEILARLAKRFKIA